MTASPEKPGARIWQWLSADGLLGHATKLGAGAVVALAITLAATPVLTRLYGPDTFGLLGVFSALVALGALIGTGRYEQAIALPADVNDAASLVRWARRLALATSLATCLILPWREAVALRLGHAEIADWLWALPPAIWLTAEIQIAAAWAVRRSEYGQLARARVAQALTTAAAQLATFAAGSAALLAGLLAGLGVQWHALARLHAKPAADAAPPRSLAQRYRTFPLYVLPAVLIDTASIQIPALFGSRWFDLAFVGQYTLAARILSLPVTLANTALAPVFYQTFGLRSPGERRGFLFRTWLKLAVVGVAAYLPLACFGERLFGLVLGPGWETGGAIAVVLTPMYFAMFISSPTSGALHVLQGQHYSLGFSLCYLAHRFAGFWLGAHLGDYLLGLALVGGGEIATILGYNAVILRRLAKTSP